MLLESEDVVPLSRHLAECERERSEKIHVKASANGLVHGRNPRKDRQLKYRYRIHLAIRDQLEVRVVKRKNDQVTRVGLAARQIESAPSVSFRIILKSPVTLKPSRRGGVPELAPNRSHRQASTIG